MKVHGTKLDVVMDDGRELEVTVDQRDYAAWEAAPENDDSRDWSHTRTRFIAWNALKRAGEVKSGFKHFNTVECVQVMLPQESDTEAESEEEAGEADPTRG